MKRPAEEKKPEGVCSRGGCHRTSYNNVKTCAYHLLLSHRAQLSGPYPELAQRVSVVINRMSTMSNMAEIDQLFEHTKRQVKHAKKTARPPVPTGPPPLTTELTQTYQERTSESVVQRQRVSTATADITRERRPDGTVLEHETVLTSTSEFEVEHKREVQRAVTTYLNRVATEQHQWTQQIRNADYWDEFCQSVQYRCETVSGGLFKYADLPLEQSLDQHEAQLQTITAAILAAKPPVLTLASKLEWLRFANDQVRHVYPQTARAFKRIHSIFNAAATIKAMDQERSDEYNRLKALGQLPKVAYQSPCLRKDGLLTRKNLLNLEADAAAPMPRTNLTEDELMDLKNAFGVYCSFEHLLPRTNGPKHTHLGDQLYKIEAFVEEFMKGQYGRLMCAIASWQIAWRVMHGVELSGFSRPQLQNHDGMTNEYVEMQDRDAATIPFYNPDHQIRLSWVRLSVDYQRRGFELILPDFVALRLFGAPVARWHREQYCPVIAAQIAHEPRYNEQSFVHLDGKEYPRSVVDNAPEFQTVLAQLANRKDQSKSPPEAQLVICQTFPQFY